MNQILTRFYQLWFCVGECLLNVPDASNKPLVVVMEDVKVIILLATNKKLYQAFRRQANGLTLNTPVFQGLLRVNGKAEKDA